MRLPAAWEVLIPRGMRPQGPRRRYGGQAASLSTASGARTAIAAA